MTIRVICYRPKAESDLEINLLENGENICGSVARKLYELQKKTVSKTTQILTGAPKYFKVGPVYPLLDMGLCRLHFRLFDSGDEENSNRRTLSFYIAPRVKELENPEILNAILSEIPALLEQAGFTDKQALAEIIAFIAAP